MFTAACQATGPPGPHLHPPLEPLEYTAESRDRTGSQHDIQCNEPAAVARGQKGSSRCELPGMHSLPKSAVLPYASGVGGMSRRLLNRATPYVAAAGHSPSSAMGQTAADPASSDLHFSPGAVGTLSFRRRVFAGNPHHRRGFPVPQAAPPKSIKSTVLPNTPFPKSKERMLGCWGVPEAGIRARIMSISGALGAEKPAAKRPRSYMDGPCGRKLSIMSTVLPNTPSQKSKEQILSFLGGAVYGRMLPVAASPKKGGGGRARPPHLPGALCACGILSIYLSIYIYLPIPLYNIYIYTSLSLSLFEQVKLLERA